MRRKYTIVAFTTLLIVLLTVQVSNYILFVLYQSGQKEIMREKLKSSDNVNTLTFYLSNDHLFKNKGGLEWKDENKEVVYQGKYYEILGIKRLSDCFILKLKEDIFENKLISRFTILFQNSNQICSFLNNLFQFSFYDCPVLRPQFISFHSNIVYPVVKLLTWKNRYAFSVYRPPK